MTEIPLTASGPLPSPGERRLFMGLSIGAGIVAALLPVGMVAYWLGASVEQLTGEIPINAVALGELDLPKRLGAVVLSLIPMSLLIWGLLRVRQSFMAFAEGAIFSSRAITGLRDFAIGVGGSALIKPAITALLSLYLTWSAPAGSRQMVIQFGSDTALFVLFAATFLAATWTMQRAAALAEENSQFV